jgi:hypothetical protein
MSEKRPEVVCTPVLNYSKADANHIASLCPYKFVEGKENLLAVFPFIDKEGIEQRKAILHVVHYVKNDKGESSIEGEWQCKVPILQTPTKHIFQADIKSYDTAPTGIR